MSNKMNGRTLDIKAENIEKLKELFPEVESEGKIDFEILKQILGEYIEDSEERYKFTWNGKGEALRMSQTPSMGTLRPAPEESKDWDETENLYIEGDNLEVLKLIQKSYFNKVKLIYIDPPYNTGKDFVYTDNFKENIKNYKKITGQVDNEGYSLSTNPEYSGRYHTDWLNMMYPRLRLARSLLTNDGVIFISIDDNEVHNLKKVCDEIFGEDNFLANIVWERAYAPINLKRNFSENHDYILVYGKDVTKIKSNGLKRTDAANDRYINPDNDSRGVWKPDNFSVGPAVEKNVYSIVTPGGREVLPPSGYSWRLSKEKYKEYVEDNRIWFGESGNNVPALKRFLNEVKSTITPMTIWKYKDVGHSQSASQALKKLFDDKSYFTYPKPVDLIKRTLELYTKSDSIILDFFAGSSTTAQAVMELNEEDNGNRKFIMVQLPEAIDKKTEAYKAGYKNIAEIGKERIRRSGEKIKSELQEKHEIAKGEEKNMKNPEELDIGFKTFKLDSSNIKKWNPGAYDDIQLAIEDTLHPYVEGRTEEDVVYEMILKMGLDLTYPVEKYEVDEQIIYSVGHGFLMISLSDNIGLSVARKMIEIKEENNQNEFRAIFRDEGFNSDTIKTNVKETLKSAGLAEESFITL